MSLIQIPGKDGRILAINPEHVTAIEDYPVNLSNPGTLSKVFVAGQHLFLTEVPAQELIDMVNIALGGSYAATGCEWCGQPETECECEITCIDFCELCERDALACICACEDCGGVGGSCTCPPGHGEWDLDADRYDQSPFTVVKAFTAIGDASKRKIDVKKIKR